MQHQCTNEAQPAKFFTHKSQGEGESDRRPLFLLKHKAYLYNCFYFRKKTTFAQLIRKQTIQATTLQEARGDWLLPLRNVGHIL
jgi:hypothetical protein